MSIGIAIAVPDGIALAADTQTTWNRTILTAKEKSSGKEVELAEPITIPVGWSRMARKLFHVDMNSKTYAVITAGMAQMNSKSMYAVIRSAALTYEGNGEIDDVSEFVRDHLKKELAKELSCQPEELAAQPFNVCEIILATYEANDVTKPVIEAHSVFSGTIDVDGDPNGSGHILKWSNRTKPSRYGGCWVGRNEFISHIVNHTNSRLPDISSQFGMMTLADAVDYTKFLVEFTCDFQRFAVMVPDCGRPITSSTLIPESYHQIPESYQENVVG
jgi:hypothetical protein